MNSLNKMQPEVDVLVVGAGPTGLMVALELLRYGLSCRIIDKSSGPTDKSKAIGVQARTLEIMQHLGIVDECVAQGVEIVEFISMSKKKKIFEIPLSLIPSQFPFILSLEQSKLEAIFIRHLEKLGCQVEREVELLYFQQNEKGVKAVLQHSNGGELNECESSWLIGCDGAHSLVRKQLNLKFEGKSIHDIISLADLDIDWEYPHNQARGFFNTQGLMAALPLKGPSHYRLIFTLDRVNQLLKNPIPLEHAEISPTVADKATLEEIQMIVNKRIGTPAKVSNMTWTTNFSINSRIVEKFQIKKVFLVGDAAHIHSPVGGQGMNTGIQDAFNLIWKLAYVHKGWAKKDLLESYTEERHYVGKQLLKGTEYATNMLTLRSPLLVSIRNFMLHWLLSFSGLKRKIAEAISQTQICYPKSRWIVQNGSNPLKAGIRAPDAAIRFKNKITSLYTLWKGKKTFQLLLIDKKGHAEKSLFSRRFAEWVDVYLIDSKEFKDFNGAVDALYGDGVAYLIRPDGIIGYCGPIDQVGAIENYLENLFI